MRIAQVTTLIESIPPRSKNGLEFVVSWLTEELVRRGHEVTLFASADSDTLAQLSPLFDRSSSADKTLTWGHQYRSIWNESFAASRQNEFDIIHDHGWLMPFFMPFVEKPVISTLHEAYRDDAHRDYYLQESAKKNPHIAEQFAKIHYVTVSRRQEELFGAATFFRSHRTIHNGIPVEQFQYNDSPGEYLLYLGWITPNKGADIAIRIAKECGKKLIIAGGYDADLPYFETEIAPQLSDMIEYVGPIEFEEKQTLYANAAALLAPLRWEEPFGLTLVEAQACGTPVIAFNKGASAEVIHDGHTGYLVDTEEEMLSAIEKLGAIERSACRAWVEEHFSVEKMTDAYEALYTELMQKT